MLASRSISAILTAHGSAAPTRTPTDCCASIFQKAPISAGIAPMTLRPWRPPSTQVPERRLLGKRRQRRLTNCLYRPCQATSRTDPLLPQDGLSGFGCRLAGSPRSRLHSLVRPRGLFLGADSSGRAPRAGLVQDAACGTGAQAPARPGPD